MSGISIIYITAAICSLILLIIYSICIKKKNTWFWVLFSCICVVNVGYFALSISKTLGAVFVNICVWLIEQFVKIELEFLSISYIMTELFLIGVYIMIQENEKHIALAKEQFTTQNNMLESSINNAEFSEQTIELFRQGITALTQTEKLIYDLYIEGKSTKEVLDEMNIKENTLKYHNKNIYGKLGVGSRKELKAIAKII